jgi:hypothetical protein
VAAKVGDRLVMTVKSKRVAPNQRSGTIEEVLAEGDRARYVVRWDDGRSTVIAPNPGSVRIESGAKAKRAARASKAPDEPYKQATPRSVKLKTAPRRTKVKKR